MFGKILKTLCRIVCLTVPVILFLTASSASERPWVLRMDGIGPLKIGMNFSDANKASGNILKKTPKKNLPTESCDFIPVKNHPGLALMFVDGRLKRMDVFRNGIHTQTGIVVGANVQQVLDLYPNAEVEPNEYEPEEQYITATSENGELSIRFETRNGKIYQFYAGESKAVHYTEQCL